MGTEKERLIDINRHCTFTLKDIERYIIESSKVLNSDPESDGMDILITLEDLKFLSMFEGKDGLIGHAIGNSKVELNTDLFDLLSKEIYKYLTSNYTYHKESSKFIPDGAADIAFKNETGRLREISLKLKYMDITDFAIKINVEALRESKLKK